MRKLFLLCLILAITVLASACGDDDSTSSGTTDPADSTSPNSTVPDSTLPDTSSPDSTLPDTGQPPDDGPILGAGPYPVADLTVSVTLTDGGDAQTYRVTCLGDTATLTGDGAPANADTMCLALADDTVRDRIVLGDPGDRACTEQWGGPEVATISGTFDGVAVDTDFHRNNGCGIGDWELLDRILPSPA